MRMVVAAQEKIRDNNSIGLSTLIQSVRRATPERFVRQVWPNVQSAEHVEKGTKPGYMPNRTSLEAWLRAKKGMSEDEAKRASFPLARHIRAHGTKEHPFMQPAFDGIESRLTELIQESVEAGLAETLAGA